jgi:hypothetical protein
MKIDRNRHYEAGVVIGVLTNQINSAGAAEYTSRPTVVPAELGIDFRSVHGVSSSYMAISRRIKGMTRCLLRADFL